MLRVKLIALTLFLSLFPGVSGLASAADRLAYDAAAFAAAQKAGKTIVVDIHATWCPTCARQEPILAALADDPAFAEAVFFRVDFDGPREVLETFNVVRQSTLIVFKGTEETGRSIADTDPGRIRALFETAL